MAPSATHTSWQQGQEALREEVRRVATLLRSIAGGDSGAVQTLYDLHGSRCFGLALLCKESAVMLPAILLLAALLVPRKQPAPKWPARLRVALRQLAPFWGVAAVYLALHTMKKAQNPRKALLIISDGGDNSSRYSETEVKNLVREHDVLIYAVRVFESGGGRMRSLSLGGEGWGEGERSALLP